MLFKPKRLSIRLNRDGFPDTETREPLQRITSFEEYEPSSCSDFGFLEIVSPDCRSTSIHNELPTSGNCSKCSWCIDSLSTK